VPRRGVCGGWVAEGDRRRLQQGTPGGVWVDGPWAGTQASKGWGKRVQGPRGRSGRHLLRQLPAQECRPRRGQEWRARGISVGFAVGGQERSGRVKGLCAGVVVGSPADIGVARWGVVRIGNLLAEADGLLEEFGVFGVPLGSFGVSEGGDGLQDGGALGLPSVPREGSAVAAVTCGNMAWLCRRPAGPRQSQSGGRRRRGFAVRTCTWQWARAPRAAR
jgi:hypothetical protein